MGIIDNIKSFLGIKPKIIKTLYANITINNGEIYVKISFLRDDVFAPELIRLCLHYYAKILYIFDPNEPSMKESADILMSMIGGIIKNKITENSNLFEITNIRDVIKLVDENHISGKSIKVYLTYIDQLYRSIETEIHPNVCTQEIVFSVIALFQYIIKRLKNGDLDILRKCLMHMNYKYLHEESFSDLESLFIVPNNAYLATIKVEIDDRFV
jgi:hypothetical protein